MAATALRALTSAEIAHFRTHGYVTVRAFADAVETAQTAQIFADLMSGAVPVEGKDRGEHTPGLMNVTAFSLYHRLEDLGDGDGRGVLARLDARALDVTHQLFREPAGVFARDYEQLLSKLPGRPKASFPPHQDQHYWPRSASGAFDTRTATVSIAVNRADEENGCLWVLPGSHAPRALYAGAVSRRADSRPDGGGVIDVELTSADAARRVYLPLAPGDATVHDEWLVHGSGGNAAATATRDTLILAYRARSMIAVERSVGFRHSYNDGEDVLRLVREGKFA